MSPATPSLAAQPSPIDASNVQNTNSRTLPTPNPQGQISSPQRSQGQDNASQTPEAKGIKSRSEVSPRSATCTSTSPATWAGSNIQWHISDDGTDCTLHVSGGTTPSTFVSSPRYDQETVYGITQVIIEGNLTIRNTSSYQAGVFGELQYLKTFKMGNGASLTFSGTGAINLFYSGYWSLSDLESVDTTGWDTSQATSLHSMFDGCGNLDSLNTTNWNTSQVTDFSNMFNNCNDLAPIDTSKWDTSRATNMDNMFHYCRSWESLDISNFDTRNVTTANAMMPPNLKKIILGTNTVLPPSSVTSSHDDDPVSSGPMGSLDPSHWWREQGNWCQPLAPTQVGLDKPATYVRDDVAIPSNVSCVIFAINPNGGVMSNAGTGFDSAHTGGTLTVPSATNLINKSGSLFANWNTSQNGSGTAYTSAQQSMSYPKGTNTTVTFYAQWYDIPLPTFNNIKVHALTGQNPTFDLTINSQSSFQAGDAISAYSSSGPSGQNQLTWYSTSYAIPSDGYAGPIIFSAQPVSSLASQQTQWKVGIAVQRKTIDRKTGSRARLRNYFARDFTIPHVTLSFDLNTGDGKVPAIVESPIDTDSSTATFAITRLTTISKPNFAFDKWASNADGSGSSVSPGGNITFTQAQYQPDNKVTLYAQWRMVPFDSSVAYHRDSDTVTASGTALQYSTINACISADTCQSQTISGPTTMDNVQSNTRNTITSVTIDPLDPGNITISGKVGSNILNGKGTFGRVVVFPRSLASIPAGGTGIPCPVPTTSDMFPGTSCGQGESGLIYPLNSGKNMWTVKLSSKDFIQAGYTYPAQDPATGRWTYVTVPDTPEAPGFYDIYVCVQALGPASNFTNILKLRADYPYRMGTSTSPWKVSFPASTFMAKFPIANQYSVDVTDSTGQVTDPATGNLVEKLTMKGTLPYMYAHYDANGATGTTPPDGAKALVDTTTSNSINVTLPKPNALVNPAHQLFTGWATDSTSPPTDAFQPGAAKTFDVGYSPGDVGIPVNVYAIWKTLEGPTIDTVTTHAPTGADPTIDVKAVDSNAHKTGDAIYLTSLNGAGYTNIYTYTSDGDTGSNTWTGLTPAQLRAGWTDTYDLKADASTTDPNTGQTVHSEYSEKTGVLPFFNITFDANSAHHGAGDPPDGIKTLADTTNQSATIILPKPTATMTPAAAIFTGWSKTASSTAPDIGMGSPGHRQIVVNASSENAETDLTFYAIWNTVEAPVVTGMYRNASDNTVIVTGTSKPWSTADKPLVDVTGLDGQPGNTTGNPVTFDDSLLPYDGSNTHPWTLTLTEAQLPKGGSYRVKAKISRNEDAWRDPSRTVEASDTKDYTILKPFLHGLPMTGGIWRRVLPLGIVLAALVAGLAMVLRDRRRRHARRA